MIEIPYGKYTRIKRPKVTQGNFLRMYCQEFQVQEPDSPEIIGPAQREFIATKNAVAVLPYCSAEQKVLMMRQFRMPVMHDTGSYQRAWLYEIIAGIIDSNESPLITAIRETKEEANVDLDNYNLDLVADYYVSPGISTERHYVFVCDLPEAVPENPGGGLEEEHEALKASWLTYNQIRILRKSRQIEDGKTLMALMHLGL